MHTGHSINNQMERFDNIAPFFLVIHVSLFHCCKVPASVSVALSQKVIIMENGFILLKVEQYLLRKTFQRNLDFDNNTKVPETLS